jgi:hypothetical protein
MAKESVTRKFMNTVVPGIIKPLRTLWNEMMAFLFIAGAVLFGSAAYREHVKVEAGKSSVWLVMLPAFAGFVFLVFGIQSYFKARKISKS